MTLLPYLEQGPLTQAFNFGLPMNDLANLTADLARPGLLVCPSDPAAFEPVPAGANARDPPTPDPTGGTYPTALTSYAFSYGTLWMGDGNRVVFPTGDPFGQMDGCFNNNPAITPAAITDSPSHTFFAGERATTLVNKDLGDGLPWGAVVGGRDRLDPPAHDLPAQRDPRPDDAGGLSPRGQRLLVAARGGFHMLMGDGSVRFVAETINSWAVDPRRATRSAQPPT